MDIITLLFMNLNVAFCSWLITFKLLRLPDFLDSIICCFILYFAQIIFTELILGIIGALYLINVILMNLALLFIFWLITKKRTSVFNPEGVGVSIQELLKNKTAVFAICALLGFGLIKVSMNLLNPPLGWDSLNYHFTFAIEWLKHGNLDTPITVFDDPGPTYYPLNGSLYFLWLMLPLKNVFISDLGQFPFFILAFLAVYNISKKVSLDKELSFYAAALFILTPNLFKQLQVAYVDVMVGALFLVCVNFLFILNEDFSLKNTLIYSMSFGLLLGTKTVAFPYCILLFAPFVYLLFKNVNKSYLLIYSAAAIVILGGFSYMRNFFETGNPLYPLDLKLFGKTIFKGVIDKTVYSAHFKIADYSFKKMLFHEGLGIQTLIFVLPGMLAGYLVTLIKNKKSLTFNFVYFLFLPMLIFLVYRFVIPLANTRYLHPLLGLGIVIGFYSAKIVNMPKPFIKFLVVIIVLASASELGKRQELVASIILFFLLFVLSPLFISYIKKQKDFIKNPAIIFLALTVSVVALILIEKNYLKNEYPGYIKMEKYTKFWPDATRAWDWLNSNTTGNNIAYAGRPVPFPLYGTSFKNNVYYVSVNKTDPAKLHYFPGSRYQWGYDFLSEHRNFEAKGNYRSDADYPTWLNNLKRRKTDFLFAYSLHQTKEIEFPMEDNWAKLNPDKFIPVFTNATVHIYKIN